MIGGGGDYPRQLDAAQREACRRRVRDIRKGPQTEQATITDLDSVRSPKGAHR
jgi:hypothetical protein